MVMTMDQTFQRTTRERRIKRAEVLKEVLEEIPVVLERLWPDSESAMGNKARRIKTTDLPGRSGVAEMTHWYFDGPILVRPTPLWRRLLLNENANTYISFWLREDGEIVANMKFPGQENTSMTSKYEIEYLGRWDLEAVLRGLRRL